PLQRGLTRQLMTSDSASGCDETLALSPSVPASAPAVSGGRLGARAVVLRFACGPTRRAGALASAERPSRACRDAPVTEGCARTASATAGAAAPPCAAASAAASRTAATHLIHDAPSRVITAPTAEWSRERAA